MKMQKNERGITLVALVVTIVVLLILAGVTIMYVMSDNGIFGQAQNAGTETNINAVREAVEMAISGLYPEVYNSDATDLSTALQTSFTSNLSATMQGTGFVAGDFTATKGDVGSLKMGTETPTTIVYKGVTYTVTYTKTDGVKVVGNNGLTSTTAAGTSKVPSAT